MNETIKSMQHLNNADKRAVRAYRILSHAFFSLPSNDKANDLLLVKRNEISFVKGVSFNKFEPVARVIVNKNWDRWITEARAAGLR